MVVEGHPCAFLYEKQYKAVVLAVDAVDGHSIQIALEVVRAVTLALNAHLLRGQGLHAVDHVLAAGVRNCSVEERTMAGALLGGKT